MYPHSDCDGRPHVQRPPLPVTEVLRTRFARYEPLSRRPRSRRSRVLISEDVLSEDQHYTRHEKQNQYDVGELRFV
jgi:hypothetical protein